MSQAARQHKLHHPPLDALLRAQSTARRRRALWPRLCPLGRQGDRHHRTRRAELPLYALLPTLMEYQRRVPGFVRIAGDFVIDLNAVYVGFHLLALSLGSLSGHRRYGVA